MTQETPDTVWRQASLARLTLFAWCAHRRAAQGEYLRAQRYLSEGVDVLLRLLAGHDGGTLPMNTHSARRGVEKRDPELARDLLGLLLGAVAVPELRLLEICDERLRPVARDLCWSEFRQLLDRLRSQTIPSRIEDCSAWTTRERTMS